MAIAPASATLRVPDDVRSSLWLSTILWFPDPTPEPGWTPVTELTSALFWDRAAADYQDWLGCRTLTPGASCALQHYTGRYVGVVLAVWAGSGLVLTTSHRAWLALITSKGSTEGVSCPGLPVDTDGDAHAVATSIVEHCAPIVDAVREAAPLTAKVAWGCVAASCAGAFRLIYGGVAPSDRERVAAAGKTVLDTIGGVVGRELVTWQPIADPPALFHDRTTCCLIRLGRDHAPCGTCPDLDEPTRRARQRAAARDTTRHLDMPWGAGQ